MKPRRHLLGGLLLIAAAVVSVISDWTVLDERMFGPVAVVVGLVGLANVAVGLGRPAIVRTRTDAVEVATFVAVALLGLAFVVENALSPDGPLSYFHAVFWGLTAVVFGRLGIAGVRSRS